jgi:hypothetical protein
MTDARPVLQLAALVGNPAAGERLAYVLPDVKLEVAMLAAA